MRNRRERQSRNPSGGAERKPGASVGPPKKEETPRKPVDKGRIVALANAGWKVKEIAIDAKCSEATVYNVLKEAKKTNANSDM